MGRDIERAAETNRTRSFLERPSSDSPNTSRFVAAVLRGDVADTTVPGLALSVNALPGRGMKAAESTANATAVATSEAERRRRGKVVVAFSDARLGATDVDAVSREFSG